MHPARIDIPPGLRTLARQIATFPEWREAMVSAIGDQPALEGWTADRSGDLGVMLIEFWAYVLDVSAFYDARLAERAYLGTAHDADSAAEIVSLLGYVPRPALAASVKAALEASGVDPITVPARSGFRSEAFDDEPPQVFETQSELTVWPQRNRWTLAPSRSGAFDGTLRFRAGEGPSRGAIVVIALDGVARFAGEVAALDTDVPAEGERYTRVSFREDAGLRALEGQPLAELRAYVLTLAAPQSPLACEGGEAQPARLRALRPAADERPDARSDGAGSLILDALYPQIAAGSVAALEVDGALHPVTLQANELVTCGLTLGTGDQAVQHQVNASRVTFSPGLGRVFAVAGRSVYLHAVPRELGQPTRPAERQRTLQSLVTATKLALEAAHRDAAPAWGEVIAVGQAERGALLSGAMQIDASGRATFAPDQVATPSTQALAVPIELYGNVVELVRGETVAHEVLGSGDASRPFQEFRLKKKPLTWVVDAAAPSGRSPQLALAVDGVRWSWVETLFGARADEHVYTVRMDPGGAAHVSFGDGVSGSRLPTGVANVVASYRFGAGSAKPPAGSIKQVARPVKGLTRVVAPLPAYGGADAESVSEIRATAPASMLSLGRAVSAADYLAIARAFSGVVNASVTPRWDDVKLRVSIDVAIIADEPASGDGTAQELVRYLQARSAPGVPVSVSAAHKVQLERFDVAIEIDELFDSDGVRAAATGVLFHPRTGSLSPANVPIGAPVFRSVVTAALHAVPGVKGVAAIELKGKTMGKALVPPIGAYYDFLAHGRVV